MGTTSKRSGRESQVETLEPLLLLSAGVTDLAALHQDGQTFLTWQEDTTIEGEYYNVYRHDEAITADNIDSAELLTARWGPLDDDTSVHKLSGEGTPQNFVISDLGQALSNDTGLFVYTTQDGEEGDAFYAVTLVVDGVERVDQFAASLAQPVQEFVDRTSPVLVNSVNNGRGLVFTQFMDYKNWNPSFQGYAYNYAVALPQNYDPSQQYPLKVQLHAYNQGYRFAPQAEFGWDTIQLFVDDPGADRDTLHTWWYGFAADHNYLTDGPIPTRGTIENFTEQRILKAIDEVIADVDFNVDTSRIHAVGHSMGGSGALSLGLRYGNVFSGIYSSQGITNYAASPAFQNEFVQLWGTQSANLQIANGGVHAGPIARFSAGQPDTTGVWDWLDQGEQLLRRRGEETAFLMFGHGKDDTTIDWETQGRPFIAAVEAANVAYTSEQRDEWTHNWMGFEFAPHTLFSGGFEDLGDWVFEDTSSYLALSNASGSGPSIPGTQGTDQYNLSIDWATSWNGFHSDIVDTQNRYEVSVRSLDGNQTADITPRNLQAFNHRPGDTILWQNISNVTGQVLQQDQVVADADGLVTIPAFAVNTGLGNRLVLTNSTGNSSPAPNAPSAPIPAGPNPTTEPPGLGPRPQLSIDDTSVVEGNSMQKSVRVSVRIDGTATESITARFTTESRTAVAGEDFIPVSGEVTIDAGNDNGVIDISILGDTTAEPHEVFTVTLSDVNNASLADGAATIEILDDDSLNSDTEPVPESEISTLSLQAEKDTVLTSVQLREANLGAAETLSVYSTLDGEQAALLSFDLPNLNASQIANATLRLTQQDGAYDDSPIEFAVFALTDDWSEGNGTDPWALSVNGATWNSRRPGVAWNGGVENRYDFGNGSNGIVSTRTLTGFNANNTMTNLDVTKLVRAWLNQDLPNHGLAIRVTQGLWSEYLFASSEASDPKSRPTLMIELA